MNLPLQITFRGMPPSPAVEARIRERAEKLGHFCDSILRCHVWVDTEGLHHHQGHRYTVRIVLHLPAKKEIAVSRESDEDIYVAIRDAFDAAVRQVEDAVRSLRGDVKHHEPGPMSQGRVAKLFEERGYGFLESSDGREIYFHENAVQGEGFGRLQVGAPVRYSEEPGEKGAQASVVLVER